MPCSAGRRALLPVKTATLSRDGPEKVREVPTPFLPRPPLSCCRALATLSRVLLFTCAKLALVFFGLPGAVPPCLRCRCFDASFALHLCKLFTSVFRLAGGRATSPSTAERSVPASGKLATALLVNSAIPRRSTRRSHLGRLSGRFVRPVPAALATLMRVLPLRSANFSDLFPRPRLSRCRCLAACLSRSSSAVH